MSIPAGASQVALSICCFFASIGLLGCNRQSKLEPTLSGSVRFKVRELSSVATDGGQVVTWLGTYDRDGKNARFKIELIVKAAKGHAPFSFTRGAFHREENSDSSALLRALTEALQAKQSPVGGDKTNRLQFTAAILGMNLSRGSGKNVLAGGFTSDTKGDWLALKVFLADGEGEFFLNLNTKSGDAEFSIKGPEYGDLVVRELAKVL